MAMSASSSSRALLRRISGALLRRSFSDSAAAAGYHVAGGPSYMRGAVFWEPGRPLTLEEFRMPRPKAGELLIKTKGPFRLSSSPCFFLHYIAATLRLAIQMSRFVCLSLILNSELRLVPKTACSVRHAESIDC